MIFIKALKILLLTSIFALNLHANPFEEKDGLSVNLMLGGGVRSVKSRISPSAKQDFLSSCESGAKSRVSGMGAGFATFSYKGLFTNDKLALKGLGVRDFAGLGLSYELFYRERFSTELVLAGSPYEKAYKDPYLIGSREETSVFRYGARIAQSVKFGDRHKLNFAYTYSYKNVRHDEIALPSLKRNANLHQFDIEYSFMPISVGLHYDLNAAKGVAQSFDRFGFSLKGIVPIFKELMLMPSVNLSAFKHRADDEIFASRQKGIVTKFNAGLMKVRLFGVQSLAFMLNYSAEWRNSNIDFYDERFQSVMMGLGWRF